MITLTDLQSRVIGVMLEKEITTPEQYPLSLNALTNGCNQKSNRDPVLSLSESEVQNVVDELIELKQVMVDTGASGRVNKYKHRFCNTSFGSLQFTDQQKSLICVLLLRGAQTPGELRTRTNRLAEFSNVNEVEEALTQLQQLNNNKLVKKLEREPGKRESRYIHLFSGSVNIDVIKVDEQTESLIDQDDLESRVKSLEQEVNDLKSELANFAALMNK
ncbi:YceH family protein [Psychromonas sp. PT13]|uniref:YceH family protein n=1 Tax=Psychromonas sp. PT13 TaxID=3439547 RepID=UPI003EBA9C42